MVISPDEINKSLSSSKWKYKNKQICKSFTFQNYMEGITFVNHIANLAEQKNHHPDIYINWCTVEITITSHDMGGVTTNCVNLATGIDKIINENE